MMLCNIYFIFTLPSRFQEMCIHLQTNFSAVAPAIKYSDSLLKSTKSNLSHNDFFLARLTCILYTCMYNLRGLQLFYKVTV